MRAVVPATLAALLLTACASGPAVTVRKNNPISRIHRVVVLPFTDDPFVPASGLKAASFFQKEAQVKMKNVEWIGPATVLKQEGIYSGTALTEDTPMDVTEAMEPVLGQVLQSSVTVSPINPVREIGIAKRNKADAVVRGSVFYDPGTGVVESMVAPARRAESGLSIQMADAANGQVFLAFQQEPETKGAHPTANELLRSMAETAADKIERKWR